MRRRVGEAPVNYPPFFHAPPLIPAASAKSRERDACGAIAKRNPCGLLLIQGTTTVDPSKCRLDCPGGWQSPISSFLAILGAKSFKPSLHVNFWCSLLPNITTILPLRLFSFI